MHAAHEDHDDMVWFENFQTKIGKFNSLMILSASIIFQNDASHKIYSADFQKDL